MMEIEYSPRHSGAMHLLSPTHAHGATVDGLDTIRQIRRSLSRSPSKPSRYSVFAAKASAGSPASAYHSQKPTPPSALGRAASADCAQSEPKARTTVSRSGLLRTRSLRKTSPNSPLRCALSDNTNHANVTPRYSTRRTSTEQDQENMDCSEDVAKAAPEPAHFDDPITFEFTKPKPDRLLQPVMREHASPLKSSPLKRSDGVMNLEAATFGSPRSTKRRSLHGPSMGADFNIFDQGMDGSHGDGAELPEEKEHASGSPFSWSAAAANSLQRRPSSLRKSTLQQRVGPGRKNLFAESARDSVLSPALTRARSRISLDGSLPLRSPDMDSPFRRSTASDPPVMFAPPAQKPSQSAPKPHPLSHALTPSSSNSSITEDQSKQSQVFPPLASSQAHLPRLPSGFSHSLPVGAMRPPEQADSQQGSFATPAGYRMAKPLPQAFMSTGLISKRNRNMDEGPVGLFASTHMPDTPSKKAPLLHMTATPAVSGLGKVMKPKHEFGSPSAPFNGRTPSISPESFGMNVNIFGSMVNAKQITRRGSFLSIDGDDLDLSPSHKLESKASIEDLPPTPTKSTSTMTRPQSKGKSNSLRSSLFGRRTSLGPDTFASPAEREQSSPADDSSKYAFVTSTPCLRLEEDGDCAIDDSPMPFITLTAVTTPTPAMFRSQSMRHPQRLTSPSPIARRQLRSLPLLDAGEGAPAKTIISTASRSPPAAEQASEKQSPHTPHESYTPPDPSSLSISVDNRGSFPFSISGFPPATPTGPRSESLGVSFGQNLHASSSYFANDVDTTLSSRFAQVTSVGIGEFSQVYKVLKAQPPNPPGSRQKHRTGTNVWAVKKSKRAYTGVKDRQRKLHEVQILRALRGHEHVIEFVDHWEAKNHLYIQTEYCENGNLKDFLTQTGFKGRLDDFRIWKILLELSQGVKSIHDANFIHLDLKPANVFIDWEGLIKIGDFGMGSRWPAPPGLDGEGDREYIGPEVLSGRFDKPADIFSLGMIMLEIAGNIVLPDNGMSWQRLRSGDMSDLPSLTSSSDSSLVRDDSGDPIELLNGQSNDSLCMSQHGGDDDLSFLRPSGPKQERSQDLVKPPNFMVDSRDSEALDKVVQWMICPDPDRRPTIDQLLAAGGVQWVEQRRRAGATVFEGNWGPADDVLNHGEDMDMMDIDQF